MRARTAPRLAWFLWGLFLVVTAGWVFLLTRNYPGESLIEPLEFSFIWATFVTAGAVIASRRPENAIGWLFCAIGLSPNTANFASEYANYTLYAEPGSLPGGVWMAWLGSWLWLGSTELIFFLPLLFPNGRPVTSLWRSVTWLAGGALAAFIASLALMPDPYYGKNPLGIGALEGFFLGISQAYERFFHQVLFVLAVLSLIGRFRRSVGDERQQMKWFVYVSVLYFFNLLVLNPIARSVSLSWGEFVWSIALVMIPIATAIAIFKYHLYDIDLIIHRTLVYGALTALLALIYFGGVVGVGGLVRRMTGQERNTLVVAASTLAVAGLFRPARTRIQAFIDRRFYRSKYDAQQTIADFSAKMREQIDLDSLTNEMAALVRDTVQPTHVSLWVRS